MNEVKDKGPPQFTISGVLRVQRLEGGWGVGPVAGEIWREGSQSGRAWILFKGATNP